MCPAVGGAMAAKGGIPNNPQKSNKAESEFKAETCIFVA